MLCLPAKVSFFCIYVINQKLSTSPDDVLNASGVSASQEEMACGRTELNPAILLTIPCLNERWKGAGEKEGGKKRESSFLC